mmetsp:Transcript_815/g.1455  ORF Transcript_815/g.1455 Transcript_815/m.1455 type:complete len:171 (-) Transcript_815:2497-3009(-)
MFSQSGFPGRNMQKSATNSIRLEEGGDEKSRTAQNFSTIDAANRTANNGFRTNMGNLLGNQPISNTVMKKGINMHQTLDVEEDKASVADNVSAGGTRYIVGLKGGLKFYGQNSQSGIEHMNDSASNLSRSRVGMDDFNDNGSRIDYDGTSVNNRSVLSPDRIQTAHHVGN